MATRSDDRRTQMRCTREDVKQSAERGAFSSGPNFIIPPPGVDVWEPDHAGEYFLRFCPYQVSKPGHPDNKALGIWHYRRPYGAHWNVGGSGQAVICLRDTFKQGDVICTKVKELYDAGAKENEKGIAAHRSRRSCMFLVVDVKNDPKKVKIFDWSFSKFAKELEKKLKLAEAEQLDFANVDGGLVLKVIVVKDDYMGKPFFKTLEGAKDGSVCPGIEFLPGKNFANLSDEIVDQIEKIKLDEVFAVTPAEKIAELFTAGGEMGKGSTEGGYQEPTQHAPAQHTSARPARDVQVNEVDQYDAPPAGQAAATASAKPTASAPIDTESW